MQTGVVLLNFGEPATPDRSAVVDYLTRIFRANASLEGAATDAAADARARELAQRRASGLLSEYEAIGGSPLNEQARAQAERLESELSARGFEATTSVAMQFAEPLIDRTVDRLHARGVEHVVGLPVYPLCGPSTTVAALERLETAITDRNGWDPRYDEITGWHRHPTYNRLRADRIRTFVDGESVDLHDPETHLIFSAHGTPQRYLDEGSRYVTYVDEYCDTIASILGLTDYSLGFQNHENRDIPWTGPSVESLIPTMEGERVVVEPVSFMHEQSETLSELDIELREEAETAGLEFHRVPIPHDDPRFAGVLADLIEPFLATFDPRYYGLRQCVCRERSGTRCLNASDPDPR